MVRRRSFERTSSLGLGLLTVNPLNEGRYAFTRPAPFADGIAASFAHSASAFLSSSSRAGVTSQVCPREVEHKLRGQGEFPDAGLSVGMTSVLL